MKFLKPLLITGTILLGMVLGAYAAGPVGSIVGGSLTFTGLQYLQIVEMPDLAMYATLTVGNIKRADRQLDNMGGFTKMAIILPESFTSHWPKKADITGLEVTVAPPVTSGETLGNLVLDLDGGSMKFSRKGDIENANYSHEGTAKFSGVTKDQLIELDKTKGGCVIVGWDQDGRRWLAGSTKRPLKLEFDGDLGGKPDDKRQIVCKFSRDGFAHPLLLIPDTVVLPLATLTGLD
ncbi:hypothetical protein [Runella zeae]|uniref:hypothetical protein n=1 Tax=Runella zeae TaxID=94255 RepID=UPI002352FE03|nr:hypothetical protein [Runella zeae]